MSARIVSCIGNVLLLSIGFDGGRRLSGTPLPAMFAPLALTVALILVLPASSFLVARRIPELRLEDCAALATLYGSVSSAVFFAAYARTHEAGIPQDGFVTAMVGLLEFG